MADPVEAGIVREIFDSYAHRGWGLAAIAHRLNERGVPPPASLRRRGAAAWSKSTICGIIRNRAYQGTLVQGKMRYMEVGKKRGRVKRPDAERVVVPNALVAIVPPDLWEAAQLKQGGRRFGVGRPWHRSYLLSGIITCGHCGKKFQAHKPVRCRELPYYVCGGYIASGLSVCDGSRVPMGYLDEAVLEGIQKRLEPALDPDILRRRLREIFDHDRPDEGTVEALQARLAEIRRKIDRLVDAIAGGPEALPSLRAALVQLERERDSLEAELAATTTRFAEGDTEPIVEALIESLSGSREILATGDPEDRRALVRVFLRGIEIRKTAGRAVLSWYRLPNSDQLSVKLVAPTGRDRTCRIQVRDFIVR